MPPTSQDIKPHIIIIIQLTVSQSDRANTQGGFLGVVDGSSDDHGRRSIADHQLHRVVPSWVEFSWSQSNVGAETHDETLQLNLTV